MLNYYLHKVSPSISTLGSFMESFIFSMIIPFTSCFAFLILDTMTSDDDIILLVVFFSPSSCISKELIARVVE